MQFLVQVLVRLTDLAGRRIDKPDNAQKAKAITEIAKLQNEGRGWCPRQAGAGTSDHFSCFESTFQISGYSTFNSAHNPFRVLQSNSDYATPTASLFI